MALTKIKTGGLADNSVTDAKVADAITVTGAQTGITQVGTLTAGVWQGTKVASAYLDDDTAHLSTNQTFSGVKTFGADYTSFNGTGYIRGDNANKLTLQMGSSGFELKNNAYNATKLTISDSGTATFAGGDLNVDGDSQRIYVRSDDYELVSIGMAGSSGSALDQGYFRMKSAGSNKVAFHTAGDSYINGGSLGIGTTSPAYPLNVEATNAGAIEDIIAIGNKSTTSGTEARMLFTSWTAYANGAIGVSHSGSVNGDMKFYTHNGSSLGEKMRITSDGETIVRANRGGTGFQVINDHSSIPYGMKIDFDSATPNNTNQYFITCQDSTNDKFIVNSNGDVKSRTNSYGAISDKRLKENIEDATPKLDEINQVRIVNFNFKDDSDKKQLGVVAQELQKIFPKMVSEYGEDGYLGVKYSIFVPMLIKAVQELSAKVEALENA